MRIASVLMGIASLCTSAAAMAGDVTGTVYDASGTPAANVQVSIAELGLEVATGADGTYRFSDLATGEHFVIARAEGANAQRVPVNVAAMGDAQRNIFLMSRVAVRQVTGFDAETAQAEAAFSEALELAEQMVSEGAAQGEIAWRWNDLDG